MIKLKPYGFPIHGCICGYSGRIIWLELVKSNNNPTIPARLYLDAVEKVKSVPVLYNQIVAQRMLSLPGCSLILEPTQMMNLQAQRLTSMVHCRQPTYRRLVVLFSAKQLKLVD